MDDPAIWVLAVAAVLALLCLIAAFRNGRRRRLVDNIPTSKTTGVFIGLVELKGTAETPTPLTSHLAGKPCVHYQWTVDEHWSRTVTETYTDNNGKSQTRTRNESGWTTVDKGGEMIPFYLQDDCGSVLIQPAGANLEPALMFETTCGRGDSLYYGKGPMTSVSNSDHQRRFVERGILLHAKLYIMGQARERQDVVAAEIAADKEAPIFMISTRTEEQVSSGMKWGGRGWVIFGLILVVGAMIWRDNQYNLALATRVLVYIAIALGYLCLGSLMWVWMVFNSLVDLRQRVRQAWSLVDIQLKRRHDLIPNLLNCVKGFRDYEAQLQTELAALRAQAGATPPGVAGADYGAVKSVSIALAERYPELKADQSFLSLQKNLIDTEQRIALARGYFNDIATHFNTKLEVVPDRFVALLGAMKPQSLMEANDFERSPVAVDFSPTN